jgi:hypothetical protein
MVDVELEIIDLSTGQSVGKFPLDLCVPMGYELDVGNYRFRATYLKTGETQESDRSITEGENPPLNFVFAPAVYTLKIESEPIPVPVKVNDQPIGYTPQTVTVEEGEHVISVPQEITT